MKIKTERDKLVASLATVKDVVKGFDALGPFGKIGIASAGSGCIRITAANGSVQVESSVYCDVAEEGRTLLHGLTLVSFCSALPYGDVTIETRGTTSGKAKISGVGTVYRIQESNPDDFPEMHRPGVDAQTFVVNGGVFREMFRKVRYAASADKTRAMLCGVNVAVGDGKIVMVATDGKRLSTVEHSPDDDAFSASCKFTLANDTVALLYRLLGDSDKANVTVETDGKVAFFRSEMWSATVKLVAFEYPYWRRVVPTDTTHTATIVRAVLADAIKRAALACSRDDNTVLIKLSENRAELSARGEFMNSVTEIPIEYSGEERVMLFCPELILDILDSLDDTCIFLRFGEPDTSVVFACQIPFLGVVMPKRSESWEK